jgi:NADH dehydrogenase (ubiquinone) 1 beta subcomplex subunit 7
MDAHDVPFLHRDECAAPLIEYYKCLNKGTSFCAQTKAAFFGCQYFALKERLSAHQK